MSNPTEAVKLIKSHRHAGVDYVCDKETPHHKLKVSAREKTKLQRAGVIEGAKHRPKE